ELGVIGLAAYLALLGGSAVLIEEVRRRAPPLGLGLGAVLLALFVHSLAYSGFFEDPVTWLAIAIAASYMLSRNEAILDAGADSVLGRCWRRSAGLARSPS